MPGSILNADTNFPNLEGKTNEEKFQMISNYLFMLLEQLRYTLNNLGSENFNEKALDELITEPINAAIKGVNGELQEIKADGAKLESRIEDAEGNVSTLQQTATGLQSSVSSLGGSYSRLNQTVNGLMIETNNGQATIDGNFVNVRGATSGVRLKDGAGNVTGYLQYGGDSSKAVYLHSTKGNVLKLESGGNLSIDAASGAIVYIAATADNTAESVWIGRHDETRDIRIYGNILMGTEAYPCTLTISGNVDFSGATVSGLDGVNAVAVFG